jgi:hypothetical protein
MAWRVRVAEEAKQRGLGLVRALGELGSLALIEDRDLFQDVLADATTYTPEQLRQLWDGYQWKPLAWIDAWVTSQKPLATAGGAPPPPGTVATKTACRPLQLP